MRRPVPYRKLIILFILLAIFCGLLISQVILRKGTPGKPVAASKNEALIIFLPGSEGKLKKKNVEIKEDIPDKEKADMIMRELRKGNAVPENLSVYNIAIDTDGVMYLNLSHGIKVENGDPKAEIALVYAIVDSFLSNFRGAKGVQLLVEGEALHTINGLLYTYMPMEFNNQIVED